MIERWLDLSYGVLKNSGVMAYRVFNPFLLPLYTRQTFLIVAIGLVGCIFQARVLSFIMLLALLSMDFSKVTHRIWYGCVIWFAFNLVYHLYVLWRTGSV